MYNYDFSHLADSDIDATYDYIAERLENPKAAEKLMDELWHKVDTIVKNPLFRPLVHEPELAVMGFRSIKVKNFVIYYIADEEKQHVKIVRFLYNRRDWTNILKDNPSGK
jgi:plasmid stabilization system protein ParE